MAKPAVETEKVKVYEPYLGGLPKLRPYFGEAWDRRQLAVHLARAEIKTEHADTLLGRAWNLLNPLLLAATYTFLVTVLSGGSRGSSTHLLHLVSSIFIYDLFSSTVVSGASSVTRIGRLITNRPFPRLLLPITSGLTALSRFVSEAVVLLILMLAFRHTFSATMIFALLGLVFLFLFAFGIACFTAVLQVYFRDLQNLLPFALRLLMYLSPVLYYVDDIPHALKPIATFNPLVYLLTSWNEPLLNGEIPQPMTLLLSAGLAIVSLVAGVLFFISKERDFATRI